jgi:hypothetical protein
MPEGQRGAYDASRQGPYQERVLADLQRRDVERRLHDRVFPTGISAVVRQIRRAQERLGQRFVIAIMHKSGGRPTTADEAIAFSRAQRPEDLRSGGFYPVTDFDPQRWNEYGVFLKKGIGQMEQL